MKNEFFMKSGQTHVFLKVSKLSEQSIKKVNGGSGHMATLSDFIFIYHIKSFKLLFASLM
jgi:hypothetical protein